VERLRKVRSKPPIEERRTTKNVSTTLARTIMNLDGKGEQQTHEVLTLKKELAKAKREIEEKDRLLMRDSKRARGARDFYARYCSYESDSEDDASTSYA